MNSKPKISKMPIEVYAESTPNPDTLKFVCSRILLAEGSVEYGSQSDASDCPLAMELLRYSGIVSVFISANFITLAKSKEIDWYEITGIMREGIKLYLENNKSIFNQKPKELRINTELKNLNETEKKIVDLLDEYIKPAVESDGGAIDFKSYHEGVVTLVLRGSCSGCPSSTVTLKSGIETLLKKVIPEIKEVVSEAG